MLRVSIQCRAGRHGLTVADEVDNDTPRILAQGDQDVVDERQAIDEDRGSHVKAEGAFRMMHLGLGVLRLSCVVDAVEEGRTGQDSISSEPVASLLTEKLSRAYQRIAELGQGDWRRGCR